MTEYRFYSPMVMARLIESKKRTRLLATLTSALLVLSVFDGSTLLFTCAVFDGFVLAAEVRLFGRLVDRAADIAITRASLARGAGNVAQKARAA